MVVQSKEIWWQLTPKDKIHLYFFFQTIGTFYLFIYLFILYCSGFCHTLTWISHGFTCIPQPDPPPISLSTRSLWVFPVRQAWALVSCIQPGLVNYFTVDNINVSILFSQNIPLSFSPTEPKSLFCTSVSLFLFCIYGCQKYGTLHEFACHPCPGAILIFSVSFQF